MCETPAARGRRERLDMRVVVDPPGIVGHPGSRCQAREQDVEAITAQPVANERNGIENIADTNLYPFRIDALLHPSPLVAVVRTGPHKACDMVPARHQRPHRSLADRPRCRRGRKRGRVECYQCRR